MKARQRHGFTLVELLVVIAIIGLLMALLLPAIQAVRESGRRVECQNNLKQFGLALHNYHDSYEQFPAGYLRSNFAFWTSAILPYIEQDNQYDQLDFNTVQAWAQSGSENYKALQFRYEIFQCPSDLLTYVHHFIPERNPSNYLACASGLIARESGPPGTKMLNQQRLDGFMFDGSTTKMGSMKDGTASTVAVGEAINFLEAGDPDYWGFPQLVDHWPIASPSFGSNEVSEVLGTTAAPINATLINDPTIYIEDRELCFSSRHPGGAQVVLADGHVRIFSTTTDRELWSAMGTRANNEHVGTIE